MAQVTIKGLKKIIADLKAELTLQETRYEEAVALNNGLADENTRLVRELKEKSEEVKRWQNQVTFFKIQSMVITACGEAATQEYEQQVANLLNLKVEQGEDS